MFSNASCVKQKMHGKQNIEHSEHQAVCFQLLF